MVGTAFLFRFVSIVSFRLTLDFHIKVGCSRDGQALVQTSNK